MQEIILGNLVPAPHSILIAVYTSNILWADCLRPFLCKIIFSARHSNLSHVKRVVSILSRIYYVYSGLEIFLEKSIISNLKLSLDKLYI